MKDKGKLLKLIQLIGDLLKEEDNEWMAYELIKQISKTTKDYDFNPFLNKIYEYCIEEKIDEQAQNFYERFPLKSIKSQLIEDYKKMEHERRRNDFEGFCLCMFQQFEAINNKLYEILIRPRWSDIEGIVVVNYYSKKLNSQITKTLADEVLGNSSNWNIYSKYKAILFYIYFKKKIPLPYAYKEKTEVFYELYQIRNKNHRGGSLFDFQEKILKSIEGKEASYYLKFYGFLFDYINTIELYDINS